MTLHEVLANIGSNLKGGLLPANMTDEDVDLFYELGYNLYLQGDYKQAEELFRRTVLAKPMEKKHWQGLASCLQMQKRYEEALVPWSMCCLVDPENPLPHFHAAECLFSLKQLDEAAKALSTSESRDTAKAFQGKIATLRQRWNIHEPN